MRERYGYVYYNGNPTCIDVDDKGFIVGHLLYYWVGEIPTIEIAIEEAIRLCDAMDKRCGTYEDAIKHTQNKSYHLEDYVIEDITENFDRKDNTKHWRITDK